MCMCSHTYINFRFACLSKRGRRNRPGYRYLPVALRKSTPPSPLLPKYTAAAKWKPPYERWAKVVNPARERYFGGMTQGLASDFTALFQHLPGFPSLSSACLDLVALRSCVQRHLFSVTSITLGESQIPMGNPGSHPRRLINRPIDQNK